MNRWVKYAAVVAALAALVLAAAPARAQDEEEAGFAEDSPVHVLTADTFEDAVVNLGTAVLVEFYAPWCGHCKALKPAYEAAAEAIKESGLDAALAAIDATEASDLAAEYEVTGFPTIKLFKRGKVVAEYRGARQPEAMVSFVENQVLPAVQEINSPADLERLLDGGNQAVAVGHFTVPDNEAAQTSFVDAAKKIKDLAGFDAVRFAVIKSSEVAAEQGMLGTPALKMIRPGVVGEPKEVEFDFFTERGFNEELVGDWLKSAAFPNLAEVTADNYGAYERRGLPFAWCFVPGHGSPAFGGEAVENTDDEKAAQDKAVAVFREAAAAFAGKLSFVWLSAEDYAEHAQSLGVPEGLPVAMVVQEITEEGQGKRFMFDTDAEVTAESVKAWLQKFVDGEVAAHVKSEPVPEQNDGPVKVVVASTFDELVYENDDDVLIAFVAPWCGHCKAMAPAYEELATALAGVKGITLAKIDATANDVPPQIEGFPTIYFKKGSDKEHRLAPEGFYEGGRTKDELVKFLKENSDANLDDMAVPVDIERIESFMNEFDSFKDEVKRLVAENKEMQRTIIELTGGEPAEGDEDVDGEFDPFADSDMVGGEEEEEEEAEAAPAHDDL